MALNADDKTWYCKVTHYENGRVVTRRIHSIAIQATDGRLYRLTERKLPDAISLFTGETHRGEHMAEVLMNPKPVTTLRDSLARGWPTGRDVFHFLWGFGLFVVTSVAIELVRELHEVIGG